MPTNPYERFKPNELILRDELAIDRTLLANERTLLAYLRSSLTLVIVGITFLHLFADKTLGLVGLFCIPLGVAVAFFGVARYRKMNRAICALRSSLHRLPAERERAEAADTEI